MNGKMRCEIWDDDVGSDERVGTWYINFKEVCNKTILCRWANLYGPPLGIEGEYADIMTKFGDKGSTYRGRVLYGVTTHDEEKAKSEVTDLVYSFPSNPAPNPQEKQYMIKVALYEGVELPDVDNACIHVCCGPYETKSKVVKNENSRAIFN